MGPLAIPGMGPYMAAGPIIRALKGASGKSTISQSLMGMGIPESEAKCFEEKLSTETCSSRFTTSILKKLPGLG